MSSLPATATPPISRGLLFAFALPGILQGFMHAPAQSILQGIYAKESGLALVALGGAVLLVRVCDIATDLLIGYFSDRGAEHGISRKWWIAVGTAVTIVALWFLFRPPPQVSIGYYTGWFLLANIGWSLCEIPYRSWSLELSPVAKDRTRITTWIALATLVGSVLFYAVGPVGKALGLLETGELNLQTLGVTAILVALLLPLLNAYSLWKVPDGLSRAAAGHKPPPENLRLLVASVLGNVPLMRLILVFSVCNLMTGLSGSVSLLYMTNYLGLGAEANLVLALALPVSALGLPLWGWLAQRYPLQRVWSVGLGMAGVSYAGMGFLPPNPGIFLYGLVSTFAVFFVLSTLIAVPVILGDIIDYGKEKYGVDRAGLYVSFQTQVVKAVNALAAGGGLIFLGWMGFDATKSGADLAPQAIVWLKLTAAWSPAMGLISAGVLLWFLPITAESRRLAALPTSSGTEVT